MNPQSNEQTPSFNLPSPAGEAPQTPAEQPPASVDRTEAQAAKAPEQGLSAGPPPATTPPPMPASPLAPSQPAPPTAQQPGGLPGGLPMIADDTDLIEKEWVEKAKQIVERTAHDPYLQNKEINKVKIDYLKKRYNKDVKLSED